MNSAQGISIREDFQHFYFDCPTIQDLLKNSKKIFREDFKNEPKVILINNNCNNATNYEKIITGIMCYIFCTYRNKRTNKIVQMNNEFRKITLQKCLGSCPQKECKAYPRCNEMPQMPSPKSRVVDLVSFTRFG